MEISMLGNYNAVNRSLVSHRLEDSDRETSEARDAAHTEELLSRESQLSPVPPAHAPHEVPNHDAEAFVPQRKLGKQINITI